MFKNNRNLAIIALIAIVNALGYAIIIPILYSYSRRFGLSDFQNGLLFSVFSICQFISTPFIGRFSDKYGRKPVLIVSLLGTAVSFFMMAFAPSALFLFLARALDGITAGNIPVASAVISDTTEPKDRAKGFGIIGAAFSFGFIFGPAIGALTVGFGAAMPFIIAGLVTVMAIILTLILLPETNRHMGQVQHGQLFDFKKLALSLVDQNVGKTLVVSLLYSLAFGLFIFAYQPVAIKLVGLTEVQNSIIFVIFGIMGAVSQVLIIPRLTKMIGERKALTYSLVMMVFSFIGFFFARTMLFLVAVALLQSLANAFVGPLAQALLSKEVDPKSQGEIMGVYSSYISLGMIFGPIVGGAVATIFIPLPFLVGSVVLVAAVYLSLKIKVSAHHQVAL